jgi:hypothetical protein
VDGAGDTVRCRGDYVLVSGSVTGAGVGGGETSKTLQHLEQISWDPAGVCGRFSDCDATSHPGAIRPGGGGQGLCPAAGQLGHRCQQAAAQAP